MEGNIIVWKLKKVVSGGQTGVDRAALDAALEKDLPIGRWCPKGRRAEDGPIDRKYPLEETPTEDYRERTEKNVRDSDGTLILGSRPLQGGTALTVEFAKTWKKPFKIIDLDLDSSIEEVSLWLQTHKIKVLNVAGPRESKAPGIYAKAKRFLIKFFQFMEEEE